MEICGDRGKILIDNDRLRFWDIPETISRFTRENTEMWARPKAKQVKVSQPKSETGHIAITRNFCRAILYGEELIAPGAEGLWSLEVANAMVLSSYEKTAVRLPIKRNKYEELLDGLKAKSKIRKRGPDRRITDTAYTKKKKKR